MGIERFFNSLKNDFNFRRINSSSNGSINIKYLFIDFNSIVHVVSQKINNIIDFAYIEALKTANGCGNESTSDYLDYLNLDESFDISFDSEKTITQSFKTFFTNDKLDDIIIKNVGIYLKDLIKKFNLSQLEYIYLSIDGVPSKAKMVEQKKRRFMGEFEKNIKKHIVEKYKDSLDKPKSPDCNVPFNKYHYLTNHISWSRGNISPATFFMVKLGRYLDSLQFKNEINKIANKVTSNKFIVSNFTEKDEGEKKIMDYINNTNNEVKGNICIFSPDADIILLSMILKNNNLNKYVLRIDQQNSKNLNITDAQYDLVDINNLEDKIFEYFEDSSLIKTKVIDDLVFIFTFFGDDFLHKVESFDVRTDIKLILDIYKGNIKESNYILENKNTVKDINYKNFIKLLRLFVNEEDNLLKRNYLTKKYKNYYSIIKLINKNISGEELSPTVAVDFISKFEINNTIDYFEDQFKLLIDKFITVEYKPKLERLFPHLNITKANINLVPIKYFIEFINRPYNNQDYSIIEDGNKKFNKDIFLNLISDKYNKFKKIHKLIKFDDITKKLFNSSNINSQFIKNKYKLDKSDNDNILTLLLFYYYIYNELPINKYNIPKVNLKTLRFDEWPTSINNPKFKDTISTLSPYEKEIFQFDNMLDEYQTKLNKKYDTTLGNPDLTFKEGKNKFYDDFFNHINIEVSIRMYIDGLQWLVDYYYNGITYHKWYYLGNKTPLLQDILAYLDDAKDENIFKNSREGLQKCCRLSITEELTPLEQLLYITPFDDNGSQIKMFEGYLPKFVKNIQDIVREVKNNEEFQSLYPDISSIAKYVLDKDSNNEIDCRSAIFMNKCILNVVTNSNMIDESKFRNMVRTTLSTEKQIQGYSNITGGSTNDLYNKLNLIKLKYKATGNLKFKKEYKRLKVFLLDQI